MSLKCTIVFFNGFFPYNIRNVTCELVSIIAAKKCMIFKMNDDEDKTIIQAVVITLAILINLLLFF